MDLTLLVNRPRSPYLLLESLLDLVNSVEGGEELLAATYYLRNLRLCQAFVEARERGVNTRILLSGNTYYGPGNTEAAHFLKEHGFDDSSLAFRHPPNLFKRRMHLKLFLASRTGGQSNVCMFGTYNPSGNDMRERDVFEVIGDQDSGYNLLLRCGGDASLYRYLRNHFTSLFCHPRKRIPSPTASIGSLDLQFLPARRQNLLTRFLGSAYRTGDKFRIRVAVSHISDTSTMRLLQKFAAKDSEVEVIGHDSERRFPHSAVEKLTDSGIRAFRYVHPDLLPMHCKFVLVDSIRSGDPRLRCAFLGSMNLTWKSLHLNDELNCKITDENVWGALDELYIELRRASRPA